MCNANAKQNFADKNEPNWQEASSGVLAKWSTVKWNSWQLKTNPAASGQLEPDWNLWHLHVPTSWQSALELNFGPPKANLAASGHSEIGTKTSMHILCSSFHKFFCKVMLEEDHEGGLGGGMLPQRNMKLSSSEMQFPAFWALKRVLFVMNFLTNEQSFWRS